MAARWNCEMDFLVQWSDIDGNSHLNNVAVFRMFQDTRAALVHPLRELAAKEKATLVAAHIELDFRSSVKVEQIVQCRVRLDEEVPSGKTFLVHFESSCEGWPVATGRCVFALQGPNGRAVTLASVPGIVEGLSSVRAATRRFVLSKL
jgi:acyl-CoA thioesterase FadM